MVDCNLDSSPDICILVLNDAFIVNVVYIGFLRWLRIWLRCEILGAIELSLWGCVEYLSGLDFNRISGGPGMDTISEWPGFELIWRGLIGWCGVDFNNLG
jgi:hypothetical protein